jgi:hypothetical protein
MWEGQAYHGWCHVVQVMLGCKKKKKKERKKRKKKKKQAEQASKQHSSMASASVPAAMFLPLASCAWKTK